MAQMLKRWAFPTILLLVLTMLVGTTACSLAKGQNLPERKAVLSALKAQGFRFDDTLQSTVYQGNNTDVVIVTGPMGGPRNPAEPKSLDIIQYKSVSVQPKDGRWVIVSWAHR